MSVTAIHDHGHVQRLGPFHPYPENDDRQIGVEDKAIEDGHDATSPASSKHHHEQIWSEDSEFTKYDGEHSESSERERNHSGSNSDSTDVEIISSEDAHDDDAESDLVICEEKENFAEEDNETSENYGKFSESGEECCKEETTENNLKVDLQSESLHKDGESTIVNLDGFSHYFSHNLHTLHRRQLFCDVTIKVHKTLFRAHKVVLAACSPYFYDLLERKQLPDNKEEFTLKANSTRNFVDLGESVSAIGLGMVIDCMYCSRIALRHDTVHDILHAATFLNMQLVVDACFKFIQSKKQQNKENLKTSNEQDVHDCHDEQNYGSLPIDLTASATREKTSTSEDDKLETKNNFETTDSTSNSNLINVNNSTPEPEENTIYQGLSPQNTTTINPKSINWKKYKFITQNRTAQLENRRTSDNIERETNTSCKNDVTVSEDDDVFIKKETPRFRADSKEIRDPPVQSSPPQFRYDSLVADIARRRQRDLYHSVMANSQYAMHPEAVAAAMTMSSLSSPLRSPTNAQHLPFPVPAPMNPWQRILGRFRQFAPENSFQRSPPFAPNLTETKQHVFLQEQRDRQQALLNLAGNAKRYSSEKHRRFEEERKRSVEKPFVPPYSPLLLSSLLRDNGTGVQHHGYKRSHSVATEDAHHDMPEQNPNKRFATDRSYFNPQEDSTKLPLNSFKTEMEYQQKKERRSTTSSSGSPDRPYKCMVCAAEFNRPANLKTHMRIHSGEKPYKCQSCGARFVQVAHLRAHILIHTGEKPYPCKVCGTRFRHLQTLKSHLRIHTGEKPYACDECQVRFRHKSQLRLHLRTKHGINTNTKKTYQQVPGLRTSDICAHIKKTQEAVRMQAHRKEM